MRRLLLLVSVAACNQVFDLGDTELVKVDDVDTDDDGVLDVIDVCIAIANPLQEDLDGDGVGDACDECPTGSNHNEDGDALLDGCDNCPQTANDDQANADGDDLGDVCDYSNAIRHRRVLFDGFATLTDDWIPGGVDWHASDDSALPSEVPGINDLGMWSRSLESTGAGWLIETLFEAPAVGHHAGLTTRQRTGISEYECKVINNGGNFTLGSYAQTAVIPATSPVHLRVRHDGTNVLCEQYGGPSVSAGTATPTRTNPGLRADERTPFYYIDVISTEP